MIMELANPDLTNITASEPYVDLTKPLSNWFKPAEKLNSPQTKVNEKVNDKSNVQTGTKCKSIIGCTSMTLKDFEFCHKHILEDKSSPYRRCSFISKSDYRRCRNPTPILGEKRAYCVLHDKERKRSDVSKSKNKKKKKHPSSPHDKANKKRPSTLPVSVASGGNKSEKISSSDEEEFSFFTDTVQVNKTDCLWLGNQASDAESTDSEDENLMNHAGVWTVEECMRILKEKLSRIRYLYALQYKRLNYCLKEERRKMLKEYDMDAFTLSKVGFEGCSDASFDKFVEGVHLINYQKLSGPELIAEKLWREKRSKGVSLHTRRNDLPRCMLYIDGQRCSNKMLPLSKYCYNHVCNDPEQHLFSLCTFKYSNGKKCTEPASTLSSSCHHHQTLLLNESYRKSLDLFQSAKQRCENRKRKMLGKEREKKEPRAKRSSARLKECSVYLNEETKLSNTITEKKSDLTEIPNEGNIFEKGLFQSTHLPVKSTTDLVEDSSIVQTGNNQTEASTVLKNNSSSIEMEEPN